VEKQDNDTVVLSRLMDALGTSAEKVEYDDQGHIVTLNLAGLKIMQLPLEIGQLTSLRRLNLNNNQLSQLPEEIWQLIGLQVLSLNNNQLSQLPVEIGQLTNLQYLSLDNNQLSQLPVEIGQLTNLQRLSLHGNQLSQLPLEIGRLTSLQFIGLHNNQLSQLPVEIGQLTNLQRLGLHSNQLSQLPHEIGQLASLSELILHGNRLSQLPEEIGRLTSLRNLELHENQLSQLPVEIGQLTNLQRLSLYSNQLSQLPEEIGRLTSLQDFYLHSNQLSQLPVEIGRLTSLRRLNLHSNQLSQLPVEIGQLTSLQELYLHRNQLSQLPVEIGRLTSLRRLSVNNNQLSQLPIEIGQLTNLQYLSLDNNQLSQLPDEIGQLTSLQELNLDNNQLSQLPDEIGRLTNLQRLGLHGNRLSQLPEEIGQLTSLRRLNLHSNQLNQLPVEIGRLTSLQELYLHGNQLSQLPVEIGRLTSLRHLSVNNNRLSQLPVEIGQLTSLQELYLHGNQLSQLPVEIGRLTSLQELNLDNNQLSQLPDEIGQLTNLQKLSLDRNHLLLTPPPEIVAQGTQEVLAFLQAIQRESIRRYEVKLLLVGEGGTGKSSLLRALGGKAFDSSLDSTHGIEVETQFLPHPSLPGCSLVLNVWDFGGQDIYHATHQFFLTKRSLYLVVWNARTGEEQSKLDFWLKTIRVRAPEAPILLVATHIDQRAPDLNVQQYRSAYPQVVGVFQISSKTGEGIDNLREAIAQQAATLPLIGQPWPTSWVEVEQALLERPEHHIDIEIYTHLCSDKGIQAEMAQGTLGSYLHDLGKILFFRDDPLLSRMVVLKPNWITKAISRVLEDESTRDAQGILAHSGLPRIWATDEDGQSYDHSLYPAFLRLMERFDLSYQIDPQVPGLFPAYSLVPQLLPYQSPPAVPAWPPSIIAPGQMEIEMIYRLDFVPAGIMSWFIVRTHQYTRHLHWRDGVVLAYRDHNARVELFPSMRELRLAVWGMQPYTFFVILKETIDLILARFEGLQVRREVPCICHRQPQAATPCEEVYRYEEDLVRRLVHGKQTIQCPDSYEDVSVLELLFGLHVGTAPEVMAKVEEGQQEILRRLSEAQQRDELLLQKVSQLCEWNVRSFTRLWNMEMHKMEAECPNTFFLIPGSHISFNPKNWFSHDYKLYLMCQHPPGPHCMDDEYGYDLRPSRDWWVKVSPWLKYLITFLKFGVPMVGAIGNVVDAVDFKNIDAQVKLLEKITEDLPEIIEGKPAGPIEGGLQLGQDQTIGPALRFLHSFLKEVDPHQFWGGLEKVITPDGNILWLCSLHARPYEVQVLSLNP